MKKRRNRRKAPQADTKEAASTENTDNAGEQALDYVELQMYAIADAPNNTDLAKQYWEQLNTRLKEELNCTINYTYAAGNDYKNNYALAIASGEKYDLMQAAPGWLDYQTYAAKNAFMPLDDLLPQYAPLFVGKYSGNHLGGCFRKRKNLCGAQHGNRCYRLYLCIQGGSEKEI